MPGYTIWTEHGQQPISQPTMEYAYDTGDGLDQMLADFEGCLVEEITHLTSLYLHDLISSSRNQPQRYAHNADPSDSTLSLFQGRGWKSGRGTTRFLTVEEYKAAMIYIFTNLTEMDEYVE